MKTRKISDNLLYISAIGISIVSLVFFITVNWIGFEVKNICQHAKWQYGGDCVDALIVQLRDEHQGYRTRNHAIWALGQIGDSRAVPVLKTLYSGVIPEREPLDTTISQYELKKAIVLAGGGTNLTAIFWRNGLND